MNGTVAFDPEAPWALHPRVAIRPERFGALLYHYDTRRLSFLKEPLLLAVVEGLGAAASAREACVAAGVSEQDLPSYAAALATLADTAMIRRREPDSNTS
ncbi:MAG: mycofactocin biosynthesis chaperone MftB [Sporichthyaceae bacterium]